MAVTPTWGAYQILLHLCDHGLCGRDLRRDGCGEVVCVAGIKRAVAEEPRAHALPELVRLRQSCSRCWCCCAVGPLPAAACETGGNAPLLGHSKPGRGAEGILIRGKHIHPGALEPKLLGC